MVDRASKIRELEEKKKEIERKSREKQKDLDKKIREIRGVQNKQDRKHDNRLKLLEGVALRAWVAKGRMSQDEYRRILDEGLTLDRDRELFGLPLRNPPQHPPSPPPEKPQEGPPKDQEEKETPGGVEAPEAVHSEAAVELEQVQGAQEAAEVEQATETLAPEQVAAAAAQLDQEEKEGRIYLRTKFKDREQVKALGARWEPEPVKAWYVPAGMNLEPFKRWLPSKAVPADVQAPAAPAAQPSKPAAPAAQPSGSEAEATWAGTERRKEAQPPPDGKKKRKTDKHQAPPQVDSSQ